MSARVRVDRTSGRKFLDWYLDQGSRWAQVATYREGEDDPTGELVDVTGYSARLLVARADADRAVVFNLETPDDIVVGDALGTFSWDVAATAMELLVNVTYDYQLRVFPESDAAQAYVLGEGRLVMRPMIAVPA